MHGESLKHSEKPSVVCADVDGSVITTDLLFETLLFALKQDFWIVFHLPFWLLRGRAYLKRQLADRAQGLAVDLLPVNSAVVSYLRSAAESGQRVMLTSASDVRLVEKLADQFDFVSGVIGSDGVTNRKGRAKAQAIREVVGDVSWEYIGDSEADFDVWRESSQVVCVASDAGFARRVSNRYPKVIVLEKEPCTVKVFLRALRVHQWMKNILVFAPLVLAHQIFNAQGWFVACGAALSFSLCASGVYLLNDLLDLEADRRHPRKRKRPCASGVFHSRTLSRSRRSSLLQRSGLHSLFSPSSRLFWDSTLFSHLPTRIALKRWRLSISSFLRCCTRSGSSAVVSPREFTSLSGCSVYRCSSSLASPV